MRGTVSVSRTTTPLAKAPPVKQALKPVAKKAAIRRAPAKVATIKATVTRPRQPAVSVAASTRATPAKRPVAKTSLRERTAVTRLVRIKALDPCARCGPSTSVEQLYRVDEQVAGTATVHLVFFDRHGWYCVHGASCVAVRDVHAELKAQRGGSGRRG